MRRTALALAAVASSPCLWLGRAATAAAAHASLESSDPSNGELLDTRARSHLADVHRATRPLAHHDRRPGRHRHAHTHGAARARSGLRPRAPCPARSGARRRVHGDVANGLGHRRPRHGERLLVRRRRLAGGDQTRAPDPSGETEPPSATAVAGHWFLYLGLVVLFGAGVTGLVAFGSSNVRPWLLGIGWVCAAIGVVLMTLAERAAVDVPLGTLLSSEAGGKFVLLAVAVGVTGVAVLAAVLRPGRATLAALAVTAAGAMLARATGGHAGSAGMVLAQWLHFMGVGAWIGGLAWLFLGLLRRLEPGAGPPVLHAGGRRPRRRRRVGPAPIVERARPGMVAPPVPERLQHDARPEGRDRDPAHRSRCAEPLPQRPPLRIRGIAADAPDGGRRARARGGRPPGDRRPHRSPAQAQRGAGRSGRSTPRRHGIGLRHDDEGPARGLAGDRRAQHVRGGRHGLRHRRARGRAEGLAHVRPARSARRELDACGSSARTGRGGRRARRSHSPAPGP